MLSLFSSINTGLSVWSMGRLRGLSSLLVTILLKHEWRESLSSPPTTPHPTSLFLQPLPPHALCQRYPEDAHFSGR